MDFSPVIAWSIPTIGAILAALVGRMEGRKEGEVKWGSMLAVAIALGVVLTVLQVAAHGVCIDKLKACTYRGDGNMSYWFQSVAAIPVYWLLAGCSWALARSE